MQNLKFHDGKFKIMQITDIQDTLDVDAETLRLICAALDREKPDLVVLTGDQVRGQVSSMKKSENVEKVIRQVCAPMDERGIPFTFVFGNHDVQGVPAQQQLAWYLESPVCAARDTPGLSGCGNHNLVIEGGDGRPALNVYMLDSHSNANLRGYEPLQADQIAWYRETREALRGQAGDYVPSLLFQHIPVEAAYRLLTAHDKRRKGAIRGFAAFKDKFYTLDESKVYPGGRHLETLCVPNSDAGLFEAACEKGEMLGMFFGHDHKNSFAGRVDGIDLGYCPGCGFAAYGDGVRRGVRVFEFDEADVRSYKTRVLTYTEMFGAKHVKRLSHWLMDQAPSSADDAISKGIKVLLILAGIAGVVVALVRLL
ncbi:MAG: metallophosphoesterase family protein [Firmicutes bacterium]|nr:metallophosphoesterase family protein [Bacillota bacterium]